MHMDDAYVAGYLPQCNSCELWSKQGNYNGHPFPCAAYRWSTQEEIVDLKMPKHQEPDVNMETKICTTFKEKGKP